MSRVHSIMVAVLFAAAGLLFGASIAPPTVGPVTTTITRVYTIGGQWFTNTVTVTGTIPPPRPAPTRVVADWSEGDLLLQWEPVPGVDFYRVRWGRDRASALMQTPSNTAVALGTNWPCAALPAGTNWLTVASVRAGIEGASTAPLLVTNFTQWHVRRSTTLGGPATALTTSARALTNEIATGPGVQFITVRGTNPGTGSARPWTTRAIVRLE